MPANPYQSPEERGSVRPKRPNVAFFLSFLLPGAGLCYLGMWKWGLVNLAVVIAIGVIAASVLDDQILDRYGKFIGVGFAGGSAGLAQYFAQENNKRLRQESDQPAPEL